MNINAPVLVLNASYEPISICAVRRAILLLLKGAAAMEEGHDVLIRHDLCVPSVIRLRKYHRVPSKRTEPTRRNILARDSHICQYCRKTFPAHKLTLDHILPRSRNGADTWENLVTACVPCNNRKANKTPEEAGMPLLLPPRSGSIHTHRHLIRSQGADHEKWKKYLFY